MFQPRQILIRTFLVHAFILAIILVMAVLVLPHDGNAVDSGNQKIAVPENYGDAMRWYERSAKKGNARAQFYLGMLHEQGVKSPDGKPDMKEAIQWFKKAAEQGHRQAQLKLGLLYYQGERAEKDYKEAARWFEKASVQGSSQAKYNLGLMLLRGLGIAKDAARAVELFEEVVERGIKEAALHLAVLYGQVDRPNDKNADNVKQDKILGLMWLEWAKGKGLNPDPEFHKRLSSSMTPSEVEKSRELALKRLKN